MYDPMRVNLRILAGNRRPEAVSFMPSNFDLAEPKEPNISVD